MGRLTELLLNFAETTLQTTILQLNLLDAIFVVSFFNCKPFGKLYQLELSDEDLARIHPVAILFESFR